MVRVAQSGRARFLWLLLGWFCTVIGAAGLILPLLPGVPFLIIALWAFSKSSQRFHHWLYTHEVYGPPLRAWNRYRVISPKAKAAAGSGMAIGLIVLIFSGAPAFVVVLVGCVLIGCAGYVLSRPNYPPPT